MSIQSLARKKILVTGGAGFIGSNLIEQLLELGSEVVCFDNFATGFRSNLASFAMKPAFHMIEGDLRDPKACDEAMRGVEYVLHQAALGSVPRSVDDPVQTHEVNLTGTLNIFRAARDAKVKRLVYASSSSVYGDHPKLPKVETELGRPLSPYAVTKLASEHYAACFADLYGFESIGLRYFNVYGKRQDPNGAYAAVIPKFIQLLIRHERPLIYGDGTQSRDFTYIDDVVQANLKALVAPRPPIDESVFNVAAEGRTDLNELYALLTEFLGKYDPAIAGIRVQHGEPKKGDIPHSLASVDRAKCLLDYRPAYDLRRGLERSIQWYWENLKG